MKLTQMLSMRSDLLPPAALDVLSTVQSSVPPMSYDVIRSQITRELGAPPDELFAAVGRSGMPWVRAKSLVVPDGSGRDLVAERHLGDLDDDEEHRHGQVEPQGRR